MEKADMDLLELINRRGRLSERDACRIMKQIVSGVAHLHSLGMIHLDLSLENCLVFQNQSIVKICDFGHVGEVISKTVSSSRGPWNQGKILYTAPEHFYSSHAPSVLTDSYSLGIILFVLLFGRLPYVVASSCSPEFMALSYGDVEEFLNIVSESEVYSNLSKPVLNLLRRTLCGSSNRLPPQDILVHPWFLIHN
jgi:serine/threonine protein kinase